MRTEDLRSVPQSRQRRRFQTPTSHALVLAAYCCAAVALFHRGLFGPADVAVSPQGDVEVFVWWLNWFPTSFEVGQSPLTSDFLYAPDGVNALWCTSVLLLGLVLWPVTEIAGPITSYNIAMVSALALSAWCAYFAARRFVDATAPAFVAGLVYGFSPFMAHHALGHLNLTTQLLGPIALILVHRIVVRQGSARTNGLILGAAFALNALISEDTVAVVGLSTVITLGLLLLGLRRRSAEAASSTVSRARPAVLGAMVAGGLLLAPVVGFQLLGPNALASIGVDPGAYVIDLAHFVVPTDLELMSPGPADRASHRFNAESAVEQTAYLGIVLVGVLAATFRRYWRLLPEVRALGTLLFVSSVLSLGPLLRVAGREVPVPLPGAILAVLPITSDMVVARFSVVMWLAAALLLAIWLDREGDEGASPGRRTLVWLCAAVIVIMLLPHPIPPGHLDAPPFFTSDAATRLTTDRPTIVTPVAYHQTVPMAWQVASGMQFKLIGGNAYAPGRFATDGWYKSQLHMLTARAENGRLSDESSLSAARRDLKRLDVGAIVVGPGEHRTMLVELYRTLLCREPEVHLGTNVWYDVAGQHSC